MRCVWEHNGNDTLLYAVDAVGAYTRGESLDVAMEKLQNEITSYFAWLDRDVPLVTKACIVQEKNSDLQIRDADSDVIFEDEKRPLTMDEYSNLKELALKSASDFFRLYWSIPDKDVTCLPARQAFYGKVPGTAREMYEHTKNVNAYYFGEIGVDADNEGTIYECRRRGFERLEQMENFLNVPVMKGSYGELWSVRKMLRRFIWHDRIHAKAMYRMAVKTFGKEGTENVFAFIL